MIVEYIRYQIPIEQQDAFQAAYAVAQLSLQQSSHCMGYELTRCSDAPEHFILRIEWDSAEGHLDGFRKSPEFGPFFTAVKPFFNQIEEMRHYEVLSIQWKRAG